MASVDHDNTAWVGFIGRYPVIGTVKEGVEWVLAAYYDDPSLCQEKEEQIMELVKSVKMNKAKTDDKKRENGKVDSDVNGESGGASGMPGKYNVKEVPQKELVEYLTKVQSRHKANKKQTEDQKKKEQEEEEKKKIEEAVKKHLSSFRLDLKAPLTKGPLHSRGEHVFNNGICKFHSKVLERFFNENLSKVVDNPTDILQLGKHTLDSQTERDIKTEMVASFKRDEIYYDTNAALYGAFSEKLRTTLCNILNNSTLKDEEEAMANDIIDYMYQNEIYVDVVAKAKWISRNPHKQRRFNGVKEKVHDMYKNRRGYSWCIDTMTTIQQKYLNGLGFNQG